MAEFDEQSDGSDIDVGEIDDSDESDEEIDLVSIVLKQ